MTAAPPHGHPIHDVPSDDPRVQLDAAVGTFDPIPPYPPRPEREAGF